MNKSEMMKKAHAWAKANVQAVGNYLVALKIAMIDVWHEVKTATTTKVWHSIKGWFIEKNENKFTTQEGMLGTSFTDEDIVNETERAYLVNLPLIDYDDNHVGEVQTWLPKSVTYIMED